MPYRHDLVLDEADNLTPADMARANALLQKGPTPMAKKKAKSRKRRVRDIPPLPHDKPTGMAAAMAVKPRKKSAATNELCRFIAGILQGSRDLNIGQKQILRDMAKTLKD